MSDYMEHMHSLLFFFSHLGCLFLLLREKSAESWRIITRTVKVKVNLLCCVWPSDHICQDSWLLCCLHKPSPTSGVKGRQSFLIRLLSDSFSISKWFQGASLRLENCWEGRVAVKSAFLAFCLSISGALTSPSSL